jgi:hypothetical protein
MSGLDLLKGAETLLASMGLALSQEPGAPMEAAMAHRLTRAEQNFKICRHGFPLIFVSPPRRAPEGWVMFWDSEKYMSMEMKVNEDDFTWYTTKELLTDPIDEDCQYAVYTNVYYEYIIFFVNSPDAATGGKTAEMWKLGGDPDDPDPARG